MSENGPASEIVADLPSKSVQPVLETELEMVRRHIRQGLVRVTGQEARVAKLREAGRPTGLAGEMLQILCYLQKEHEAHLSRCQIRTQRDLIF